MTYDPYVVRTTAVLDSTVKISHPTDIHNIVEIRRGVSEGDVACIYWYTGVPTDPCGKLHSMWQWINNEWLMQNG